MSRVWNFAPGPSLVPDTVMEQTKAAIDNAEGTGISILTLGHHTPVFQGIMQKFREDLLEMMGLSIEEYTVLLMPESARGQYACLPMNLVQPHEKIACVINGNWSTRAYWEARKYADAYMIGSVEVTPEGKEVFPVNPPAISDWEAQIQPGTAYLHYCQNETFSGLMYPEVPKLSVPVVVDMTSCILGAPWAYQNADVIYASAQKNLGVAGLSVVVVRRSFLARQEAAQAACPRVMDYRVVEETKQQCQTLNVVAIYIAYLTLQWIKSQGGISHIHQQNEAKRALLFKTLDAYPEVYRVDTPEAYRSITSVSFFLRDESRQQEWLDGAAAQGLINLKGHSKQGGLRACFYNAMPLEGMQALCQYMKEFAEKG